MTFLEIVQQIAQEADVGEPSSVVAQSGESKRLVQWGQSAYRDICKRYRNWKFLRSEFSVNTVSGTQAYLPTACSDVGALNATITAAGFSHWWPRTFRIYKQSAGIATQRYFTNRGYPRFRDRWLIGDPAAQAPVEFTERERDKAILLGPKPDAVYVITGEYQRVAPVLALDADEPLFPGEFHEIVVWWALLRYYGFEEDAGGYSHAETEYKKLVGALERDQLPGMCLAGALA